MATTRPTSTPVPDAERVVDAVKDAAYVTIGFGVLAFQRAQVRRQELTKAMTERFGSLDAGYEAFETRLDDVVETVGKRLPDPAADLLGQAHRTARTARRQVASRLLPTS